MTTPAEPTIITAWREHIAGINLIHPAALPAAYSILLREVLLDEQFQAARIIYNWDLQDWWNENISLSRRATLVLERYDISDATDLSSAYTAYVALFDALMGV